MRHRPEIRRLYDQQNVDSAKEALRGRTIGSQTVPGTRLGSRSWSGRRRGRSFFAAGGVQQRQQDDDVLRARPPPGAARARWLRARWAPSTTSSPGSRTSSSPAPYIADTNGLLQRQPASPRSTSSSGGPNVTQDAVVASGQAPSSASRPRTSPRRRILNSGAKLIAVGAQYQKNPFCIMSLASNPINDPEDMIGKKIGVQSINEPVWNAFLKANKHRPELDHHGAGPVRPDPAGQRRGRRLVLVRHQRAQPAQGEGRRHGRTFLLNDYNYPLVSEIYIVQHRHPRPRSATSSRPS